MYCGVLGRGLRAKSCGASGGVAHESFPSKRDNEVYLGAFDGRLDLLIPCWSKWNHRNPSVCAAIACGRRDPKSCGNLANTWRKCFATELPPDWPLELQLEAELLQLLSKILEYLSMPVLGEFVMEVEAEDPSILQTFLLCPSFRRGREIVELGEEDEQLSWKEMASAGSVRNDGGCCCLISVDCC